MKTIVFYSEKGGTGATNICATFAHQMSKLNISVGIIAFGNQYGAYTSMTPNITNRQVPVIKDPLDCMNDVITAVSSMEAKPQLLCIDCPLMFKPALTLLLSIGLISLVVIPMVSDPMANRAALNAFFYLKALGIRPLFIKNMVSQDDEPDPDYLKPLYAHSLVARNTINFGKGHDDFVAITKPLIKEIGSVLDKKTNVSGIKILSLDNLPHCPQIIRKK